MYKFVLIFSLMLPVLCFASGNKLPPKQMKWEFEGFFGTVDRESAQRGYKVYKEICSACHSANLIAYRNLSEIGFSENEIKALAAQHDVQDGPNDEGLMFTRPGIPADHFSAPYPNEKASRASNNGAYPADLSLIIKARHDGANYVYSLITGFITPPAGVNVQDGMYYNPYFQNHQIAMAPPLSDGAVVFDDSTPNTIDQMARDVVTFLQWAAEPEMEKRKRMGIKVILYLLVMTALFYMSKKIIWRNVK
jgi:ubiquinol-cytochrome c reductase cytochrome c1 subunit